jgi:putative membrane protein
VAPQEPVDYRYLLANERTFLAYVRTALALQVAGLGILEFLTRGPEAVRVAFGMVVVLVGSAVGLAGYFRWRSVERAIRADADIAPAAVAPLLVVAVMLAPVGAAVLLLAT